MSHQQAVLQIVQSLARRARHGTVVLLAMALIAIPPQIARASAALEGVGQFSQQQEQQQREQPRERQQREQRERDQQQRDQQQGEQQQREEQERQQQVLGTATPGSDANSISSRPSMKPPVSDVKRAVPDPQTPSLER